VQFALDLLVSVVGLVVFAQHVWALRGHFVSTEMNNGARGIALMAIAAALYYLGLTWALPQPPAAQLVGAVIALSSLALFWAAVGASRRARLRYVFDEGRPETLVTEGPYRVVRHPFYTSYIIYWVGWAIATWSVWSIPPLLVIAVVYTLAARFEERLFAGTPLAGAYDTYRRQAGLFWPRF